MIGRTAQAFDDALTSRQPQTTELAELVSVAERICAAAATVEPRADFRTSLRARLVAEGSAVLPAHSPERAARRRRLPAVSKVSVAGFAAAGVVGMVTASAQAVPGDPLYPIKRTVEQIQVSLQPSENGKSTVQLAAAERRLTEATELAKKDSPDSAALVGQSLEDFVADGTEGTAPLTAAPLDAPGEAQLSEFVASASLLLAELKANLPGGALDEFGAATDFIDSLAALLSGTCADCSTADIASVLTSKPSPAAPEPTTSGDAAQAPAPAPAAAGQTTQQPAPQVLQEPAEDVAETTNDAVEDTTDEITGLIPKLLNGLLG